MTLNMSVETLNLESEGEGVTVAWCQLPQRSIWRCEGSDPVQNDQSGQVSPSPSREIDEAARSLKLVPDNSAPADAPGRWEYLDHTADVQLHAWAEDSARAHAASVLALHAYMVEDAGTTIKADLRVDVRASAHDEHSLLFALLDEFLYLFHTEGFVATRASTLRLDQEGDKRVVIVRAWGGVFEHGVHKQGTEVKAITYSNMQISGHGSDGNVHIYVIVDI